MLTEVKQNSQSTWRTLFIIGVLIVVGIVSGCSEMNRRHGYTPTDTQLAELQVGVDTQKSVAEKLARPSLVGIENDNSWYYVESLWKQRPISASKELSREIVVLTFTDDGVLKNVGRLGLQDGQFIVLSRRVSEESVGEPDFITRLFSRIGTIGVPGG